MSNLDMIPTYTCDFIQLFPYLKSIILFFLYSLLVVKYHMVRNRQQKTFHYSIAKQFKTDTI